MKIIEFLFEKSIRIFQIILKPFAKFYMAKYEKKLQDRNKNKNFSLIVNNCIGGVIYHRLKVRFLSPTVNLWIPLEDYVKFCMDIPHYLECELRFIDTNKPYPVAQIDDITIFFMHYRTKDEAEKKWNDRKTRINYENLYSIAIIYQKSDYNIIEPLMDDKRYKRVQVLSTVPIEDERVLYIKPSKLGANKRSLLDKDIWGIRKFEKKFDYVSFLN